MFAVILALALVFTVTPVSVPASEEQADNLISVQSEAAAEIMPAAVDNLTDSLIENSSLTVTSDGYMRVYYDGEQIGVEYYDSSFNIVSRTAIAMELSLWGGFYAGADAYYIVEGQNNTDEDDDAEVIRVIKYSTDWERLGAANITGNPVIFGGQVRYPFNYGCVQFTEYNGTLYIVTGHQGYVDESVGQGHQGFLMIAVDETEMTGQIVKRDTWHSFAQYIECDGSDLYVLEQSEGSRYTALSKIDADTLETTEISVLDYGGIRTSSSAIKCYASVDGMALSSDNVLCVGTSIDQSQYDSVTSDTSHNIYLTVTPKSDFTEDATSVKWLTDFSGDGKCFVGLKITKVNDERFMISWEEHTGEIAEAADRNDSLSGWTLHYVFVDGGGNTISSEFTAAAPISECQPVLNGSDIVYVASSSNMVNFYTIDAYSGEFSKTIYRVAGENATWNLTDGVLTISGSGTLCVDLSAHYRYPISSCLSWYFHYSSDNAWKPVRRSHISGFSQEILIHPVRTEN